MSRLCRLDALSGTERPCAAGACPFWEPGGTVLAGRCAFERLDLEGRPALVVELLLVREQLGAAASREAESDALHRYHQLLNESGEE